MGKSGKGNLSRKSFLKKLGAATVAVTGFPLVTAKAGNQRFLLGREEAVPKRFSANDQINVALIGAGMMGQGNGHTALQHPGVRMVAACDLYTSRLHRCKELYGEDIFITQDYREVIARPDVDAVIISTTDHWHKQQAIDSLAKGKAVYLEKPMVQHVREGLPLIEAEKRYRKPLLVGSQRTSSLLYEKASELIKNGEIGELNFVEGYWDRYSAIGAWQYSIPPSASPENVDWDTYLKDLPRRAWDPKQFFRWRNYRDFGTGVGGDLFVHLFSGLHMIVDSIGPTHIMSTGGLRFWKDGRDVPDVMLGLYDYPATSSHPAFNMALRVNFADGSGGGSTIRLVGSEGEIQLEWGRLVLRKARLPERPGMSIGNFSEDVRDEYRAHYEERYPEGRAQLIEPNEFIYRIPQGYDDRFDHFGYFFEAIRENKPLLQDAAFGLRACGPAVLSNISLDEKRVVRWDPKSMKVIQ